MRCKINKSIFLLIILLLVSLSAYGQQMGSVTLLGLSVEGNRISEEEVIKMSSGLNEGTDINLEDIQACIKQLWSLGLFSDVKVILDSSTQKGVYLTIKVEEYPRLEKIIIEGNKKIKKEKLEEELGFYRGQILSAGKIAEGKKRLKKKYSEKGYVLAEINTEVYEAEKEGLAVFNITIDEGKKVQIERIRFFGNTVFKDTKLRKQMEDTKENRWWGGGDFDREKYRKDKEKVLEFYRNNGYRDAEILKDSLYYNKEREDMYIDIWVQEGNCYYFGDISWEGNTLFTSEGLESMLEFEKGDVFSKEEFTKSIQENINGAYYDLGYIYAQINPRETYRNDTIDVCFVIDRKEPVIIDKIKITGNTRTKERVIRRQLRIRPGDVFSRELLQRSFRDLMMLNYFSEVIPNVEPIPEEEDKVNISFDVEEKSTDTANISAGWSELDKLIGSIGVGMNNLFGNGQQLDLNWNFGRYYRSLQLSFNEPWFLNTPTLIGVSVWDTKRSRSPYYSYYRYTSRGFSVRLGRRFTWPDNYFRGDWIYRLNETDLSDFSDYYIEKNPNNIVDEAWPLVSSSITQIINRNSLDQPQFPTRGSDVSLSTEISGGPFGGTVGFHKHILKMDNYIPAIADKIILRTHVQLGYMDKLTKDSRLQVMDFFYMGGSGMSRAIPLRGYPDPFGGGNYYLSLPSIPISGYYGGKTMLKINAELRFPVISNPLLYGLIFSEAGNTWEDLASTDPFGLRRSFGIGARIFMPMVGMLGIDYACGLDYYDQYGERYTDWRTHFVFGKSF
ncbi:MAG: outer membrane protein assembly factor BamA [bacterium]